ncbi:hypothetical protein CAPTEDRAFT_194280 [Capitella teleta]|uniref:Uncharacterized protein n=1 Tax=Capitella teleta TaxID=283909 RepID=R7V645_CAPTE|nr:hypothetical protein CAPTEDRAFT_194280 [Capitella teleta]|eukprot:ELU11816.1 hypothetical protein CAPTEDRAFT_194280 [Capitella teleta]
MENFNDSGYFPGDKDRREDLEERLMELDELKTEVNQALDLAERLIETIKMKVEQDETDGISKEDMIATVERLAKVYYNRQQLRTVRDGFDQDIQEVYEVLNAMESAE